jgi:hypothetical protein
MRLPTRISIVLGVLALAIVAALPFRRPAQTPAPQRLDDEVTLSRRAKSSADNWSNRIETLTARPQPLHVPANAIGMEIDSDKPLELPNLPPQYHRAFSPVGALLNPSDEINEDTLAQNDAGAVPRLPGTSEAESENRAKTHKIVDGDTLTTLAEKYLGSSQRWADLFEHNREVLKSPDLLPIGRVLQIPAATAAPKLAAPQLEPVPAMTPLPRGAFQRN